MLKKEKVKAATELGSGWLAKSAWCFSYLPIKYGCIEYGKAEKEANLLSPSVRSSYNKSTIPGIFNLKPEQISCFFNIFITLYRTRDVSQCLFDSFL